MTTVELALIFNCCWLQHSWTYAYSERACVRGIQWMDRYGSYVSESSCHLSDIQKHRV